MTKDKSKPANPDRRTFLKTSGLAAVAAALEPAVKAQSTSASFTPSTPAASPAESVQLLQGTDSNSYFSRGNTLPIAALPFGMAHWTLQSRSGTPWMFHPADRRIQGLRCTHQLSPWLSDYGQAIFLPVCGDFDPDPEARASSFRPEDAMLLPHSLRLHLTRYRATVELVPTERCALLTANFESDAPRAFLIEIPGPPGIFRADPTSRTVFCQSRINEGGVPENFATYYLFRFAEPWSSFDVREVAGSHVAIVRFPPRSSKDLEVRIATSFISFDQAAQNLEQELGTRPIAAVRASGAALWGKHLSLIEVQGADRAQQQLLFSCLYRAMLFPRIWHEPGPAGAPHHFSPYNGKVMPGVMYADHGYWDVYRAWYPLMSLLCPERLGEILDAWVNAYQEGGWFPQFPAPGYRACMTGSLIDAVFADAAVKGIRGFDLATAYEGLKKHATLPGDPDRGYGRRGIEDYLRLGYVPADRVAQSVAETADAAYGDFCIAQVASTLGRSADAAAFLRRSENWRHLFHAESGFLRGRNADGSWVEPFDPFTWGSPYVEGSAWQHRWDAPHAIPALIDLLGGNRQATDVLQQMLSLPPLFNVGSYHREIHEMSEMAAVDFGQYAHSNQPVHHLLYIFTAAGRPDLTRLWVRRVLNSLYSTETFPGDEDTGSMSAWYLFSAMGFYPLCPGKPEYTLGGPLFPYTRLHLPGGRTTQIELRAQSRGAASAILLNGVAHTQPTVSHASIAAGAHLIFPPG